MSRAVGGGASIEESIVAAFFDLSNQLTKLGEGLAARAGLTTQQWLVLLQVAGDPNFRPAAGRPALPASGVTGSEIALARGVSRANVSALVTQLVDKGLIRQRPEASDGRRRRLFLTAKGRAVLAQLDGGRRRANRALLATLDAGQRVALLRALRACLDQVWHAIDAGRAEQGPPRNIAASRGRNGAERSTVEG